ncbi:DUF6443 domain-containing protein [Aquimarina sp. AU119]|uniref:DUF6443 domain-containing protein n=1 Tax=Aquimarina sp. AU119 TaxID=2108528 RepID=UPI00135C1D7C|nr:DUF6443 domain-containing protein [Aquimarina sp. AU119]
MKNIIKNYIVLIIVMMGTASAFSQIGDGDVLGDCGITSYRDADGDSWGDINNKTCQLTIPAGYVGRYGDRDDGNALITNIAPRNFYRDGDGDTYGNPNSTIYASARPNGYVTNNSDYDDSNALITNVVPRNFYRDGDGDTFGNPSNIKYQSAQPSGYVTNGNDCNDGSAAINPNTVWYKDSDGDNFASTSKKQCTSPGAGYKLSVTGLGDCNDNDVTLNPLTVWYYDNDGDSFGNEGDLSAIRQQCSQPSSKYVRKIGDCNDNNINIHPNTVWYKNSDGDGFASTTKKQCTNPGSGYSLTVRPLGDCNDNNAAIHPDTVWYKNSDGDGFASTTKKQCTNPGSGYSLTVRPLGDCNDSNAAIHPDTVWYKNSDGDGFASTTKKQCTNPGSGYSLTVRPLGDCNDSNAAIHPNTVWYKNSDGDGFASTTKKQCTNPGSGYSLTVRPLGDCNDNNAAIHPNTVWYKNSDGDGFASTTKKQCTNPGSGYSMTVRPLGDCNDSNAAIHPDTVWYKNSDGDGFASTTKKQCTNPGSGYSLTVRPLGDCNDSNAAIHPDTVWYKNSDGDGFASTTKKQCTNPGSGYSLTVKPLGDCNDSDASIHPNTVWYIDGDGDTFGDKNVTKIQCTKPAGYVRNDDDYNDSTGLITNITPRNFYRDVDGDTFGNLADKKYQSTQPAGYVTNANDCNDNDASLTPNTVWYKDADGDTWGDKSVTKKQCDQPLGFVRNDDDYDDSTVNIINIAPQTFYLDNDGDGFGDPNQSVYYSIAPAGYVTNANDQCPEVPGENNGCAGTPYQEITISNENYVFTRVYQNEMESMTGVTTNRDVVENITYFDGLGRPKQQVGIKASPTAKDIVTHIEYDIYGRQAKQHLPFERAANTTTPLGSYGTVNVNTTINSYYQNTYGDDFTGMALADVNAYSESIFEPSPLNRVAEQGAPGKDWKANPTNNDDHTIKFDWDTNIVDEVVRFKVTFSGGNTGKPQLVKDGFYTAGELYVTIIKDENWQLNQTHPKDHTSKEYKDKRGRVVLKQTFNEGISHDTYYVYDEFDNLTYVIPPKVTTNDPVYNIELSELCYQYKYDHRNRLVEKKIPGKGWEYIIYDKLDQPILTQDANQKAKGEWLFTKYDALGRVAYTGKYKSTRNRGTLLLAMSGVSTFWETREPATTLGGTTVYYSNAAFPTADLEILTVNYYDNYSFDINGLSNPGTVYGVGTTDRTRSLATGGKVRVLGTNDWITTVTYYDDKARPVYVASKNDYLNTTDIVESKLDFVGRVEETKTTHTKGTNAAIVTVDKFTYDHTGRLLKQIQKINTQAEEVIAENNYDALGQLTSKKVGGIANASEASSPLQTIDYTHNVRGWLTSINEGTTSNGDLFGFALDYNAGVNPLYNGNISKTAWQTANDNVTRSYEYTYDALNRIISGVSNDGKYNLSNVSYDKMGNILSLNRKGHTNANATSFGDMDLLSYKYDWGNKLLKATDTGNKTFGFKDGTNTNNDFTYDVNGNMISDQNKGITSITYNHLNLPETVSISNSEGTGDITYIYDATGAKLKKIAPSGSSLIETEYAGNYIYKNNVLQYMSTPEGYATPTVTPSGVEGYRYVYQYKDHLDNVRLSYTKNDVGNLEIIEENNYYPFGLTHKGYNNTVSSLGNSTAQLLKFGGKEEQNELGLGWIDITARNYDSALGRWMNLDPLSDQMRRHSPYNYGFDNPIYFIDPDGMMPYGAGEDKVTKSSTDNISVSYQLVDDKNNTHQTTWTRHTENVTTTSNGSSVKKVINSTTETITTTIITNDAGEVSTSSTKNYTEATTTTISGSGAGIVNEKTDVTLSENTDSYDLSQNNQAESFANNVVTQVEADNNWSPFNGSVMGGDLMDGITVGTAATAAATRGAVDVVTKFLGAKWGSRFYAATAGIALGNLFRNNANHSGRKIIYKVNKDGSLSKI